MKPRKKSKANKKGKIQVCVKCDKCKKYKKKIKRLKNKIDQLRADKEDIWEQVKIAQDEVDRLREKLNRK